MMLLLVAVDVSCTRSRTAEAPQSPSISPGAASSPAMVPAPTSAVPDASVPQESRRRLEPKQVADAVMGRYAEFRGCYESSVISGRERGYVSIKWDIQPDGTVHDARRDAVYKAPPSGEDPVNELADPGIMSCVIGVMSRIRFPTAPEPTHAGWTFRFLPSRSVDAGTATDSGRD